jgi:hypothetical protein
VRVRITVLVRSLFVEPWAFWAASVPPLFVLFLTLFLPGDDERRVRVAGYALTLLGTLVVLYGLRDTQKLFGKPSYTQRFRAWLGRIPNAWRPRHVHLAASTGSMSLSGSAAAMVVRRAPNNSISLRLAALERRVEDLTTRLNDSESAMRGEIASLREHLQSEFRKRDEVTAAQDRKLEKFAAGSLDVALVGIVWAVFGQAYGAFPGEIAHCLNSVAWLSHVLSQRL